MRRDKKDQQWKEVKQKVFKRDEGDRWFACLTGTEELKFWELNKQDFQSPFYKILDPAHVLPVSHYPSLCYFPENIVVLNRFVHGRLDHCQNPITGEVTSLKERNSWWIRILGKKQLKELLQHREAREYFHDFLN